MAANPAFVLGASIAKSTDAPDQARSSFGTVMETKGCDELAVAVGKIVSEAGRVIMGVQASDLGTRRKPDGSPVCRADIEAERLILARLAGIMPDVPVIAEEFVRARWRRPGAGAFPLGRSARRHARISGRA